MTSQKSQPQVPQVHADEKEHRRRIADALNNALNGKLNVTGTFTVANGATSTVVSDPRVNLGSIVIPFPQDTNGKNLQPFIVAAKGGFTMTTTAAPAAAVFGYVVFG